jgi:hypothetical protein
MTANLQRPAVVVSPDGVQWRVGRRWTTRRARPRLRRKAGSDWLNVSAVGQTVPGDSAPALGLWLGLVGVLMLALVLVPLLLFGAELIILGVVLAAGVAGRVLLRRPWLIEARIVGGAGGLQRELQWQVAGWGASRRLIAALTEDLRAGRDPAARPAGADPAGMRAISPSG